MLRTAYVSGLAVVANATSENPVHRVVTLLGKLQEELKETSSREAAEYDKYACFCKDQASDKTYAIKRSTEALADMNTKMDNLKAQIDVKENEIEKMASDIVTSNQTRKARETEREQSAEAAAKEQDEMAASVKAVERAIQAMKDSKNAMSNSKVDLVQLRSMIGDRATDAVLASKPHPYEFKSNDIIATLQTLLQTFKKLKMEKWESEHELKASDDLAIAALTQDIDITGENKATANAAKQKHITALSALQVTNEEETKSKEADTKFLDDLTAQCEDKAKVHDQRTASRNQEMTALTQAKEVLQAGAVNTYKKGAALVSRLATIHRHAPAFLQVIREVGKAHTNVRDVSRVLRDAGRQLHSADLIGLSSKLSVNEPFAEVRGLIQDLIAKLENEASESATKKHACDEFMSETIAARDAASEKLEKDGAELQQARSDINEATVRSEEVRKAIEHLSAALHNATELRQAEKEANEAEHNAAKQGHEAVDSAINLLRAYYNPSLVQVASHGPDRDGDTVADLAPAVSTEEYNGKKDAGKGILDLLEVIISDFAHRVQEVSEDEEAAKAQFEEFSKMTADDISLQETEAEALTGQISDLKADVVGLSEDVKAGREILNGHEKALVKSPCSLRGAESPEQRKKQREAELESLKHALQILREWKA